MGMKYNPNKRRIKIIFWHFLGILFLIVNFIILSHNLKNPQELRRFYIDNYNYIIAIYLVELLLNTINLLFYVFGNVDIKVKVKFKKVDN